MSISSELRKETVTLPSGQEVVLRELTGDELMELPADKTSGRVAVALATGETEATIGKMGARDYLFLTRYVNKMNGAGDHVPLSESGKE